MRAVGSAIASGAERTGSWLGSGGWTSSAEGQGDAGWTGGVAPRQAWGMGSGWQDWELRKPGPQGKGNSGRGGQEGGESGIPAWGLVDVWDDFGSEKSSLLEFPTQYREKSV